MRLIAIVVSALLATSTFVQGQASNERVPAQRPIAGTVVDDQGNPIPGARLRWNAGKGSIQFTADQDGCFKAMSPIDWNFFEGPAFLGTISVRADGYAQTGKTILGGDEQTRPELEIKLKLKLGRELESGPTSLRVVDQKGLPIAGATVELSHFDSRPPQEVSGILSEKTDADGLVNLVQPHANAQRLRITSTTYGVQDFHLLSSNQTPKIRVLRYCPTGRIEVHIVGDKESRRGLQINVSSNGPVGDQASSEENLRLGASPSPTRIAVTEIDGDGRFVIPALVASKVFVEVQSPPDGAWLAEMPRQFEVAPGATVNLEIPMTRGIPVTGRIVDNLTGAPVPGVSVLVSGFSARKTVSKATATTDRDGRFTAVALPGRASVEVQSFGRGAVLYMPPPPVGGPTIQIEADAKEKEFPEIQLTAARLIIGRLVSKAGPASNNMQVAVDNLPHTGRCDDDGYFLLMLPLNHKPKKYIIGDWLGGNKPEARVISTSPLVLEMPENFTF